MYIYDNILITSSYNEKYFRKKAVEKFKTNTLFFFSKKFPENLAVYEITWKEYASARQATDDNIIRRMRIAPWIAKATDTLRIYNTYFFSTAAIITRERLNVTFLYTLPVFLRKYS